MNAKRHRKLFKNQPFDPLDRFYCILGDLWRRSFFYPFGTDKKSTKKLKKKRIYLLFGRPGRGDHAMGEGGFEI